MTLPAGAAVICLSASGMTTARRIARSLPEALVHGLAHRVEDADVAFDATMDHVATLFAAGVPVIGVCASGILIRAVAPLLADKRTEPPVLAVTEDGSAVVPLLGGHRGANAMARHCAAMTGGHAVVTTLGDSRAGRALDELPRGWRLADESRLASVMAALIAGEAAHLVVEAGDASWLQETGIRSAAAGRLSVCVTDRADASADLVMHPPVLALGAGCERGCDAEELIDLVVDTLAQANLAPGAVACVVSLELKSDEPAMLALAERLDVPFVVFTPERLEEELPRLRNPSRVVFAATGCHGVAEGAALAAAGNGGDLVVPKTRSKRATCAIARAPGSIDAGCTGIRPGHLAIVGLGPGPARLRTPEASRAIAGATDIVGYGGYLDLVPSLVRGKACHAFGLGEETERCRTALDLAAGGKKVALVSSGDPGIYAMASLVHELLDGSQRWRGTGVSVVPGISAVQLAAAEAGAPIGHDFCAISLSDLLTPRETILRRVRAAAEGDMVVAFYNPVSERRRELLGAARDILLEHRKADTPVVIGRLLGRKGGSTRHTTLVALKAGDADMLSLVLVGSSRTRRYRHRGRDMVYTPRGYGGTGA